jgi:mono/diheme cytochrome c family protein
VVGGRQYDARGVRPPRTKDRSSRLASRHVLLVLGVAVCALVLAACGFGKESIALSEDDPDYQGAVLFSERCSGCHTLKAAGAQGTGNRGERVQGPNLDQRQETHDDVLYAIRNGGFSGAIMPQNIVVGEQAEQVAAFVAKYAGTEAEEAPRPGE